MLLYSPPVADVTVFLKHKKEISFKSKGSDRNYTIKVEEFEKNSFIDTVFMFDFIVPRFHSKEIRKISLY